MNLGCSAKLLIHCLKHALKLPGCADAITTVVTIGGGVRELSAVCAKACSNSASTSQLTGVFTTPGLSLSTTDATKGWFAVSAGTIDRAIHRSFDSIDGSIH